MKYKNKYTQEQVASKTGLSVKTARKYIKSSLELLSSVDERNYRTRKDPFEENKDLLETLLKEAPELQAKTLMAYLIEKNSSLYHEGQLRSLQRFVKRWKAEQGPERLVIFRQHIHPGQQSQSDWTCMNGLGVSIAGEMFPHLLFHFILPYSGWEHITICYSESLETLTQGYEKAVYNLGGVLKEHRTDNLSAATQKMGSGRIFTLRWKEFLEHYGVLPSRNNPGESHENGSVEKSHDLLKSSINQHLMLRGSRDFESLKVYETWLNRLVMQRNSARKERLLEEIDYLKPLPDAPYHAPLVIPVRVSTGSLITLLGIPYSVPSRLIHAQLKAYVYSDVIDLYYGQKRILHFKRSFDSPQINYRHIIDSLIRKPGAFENYQYKECLFPSLIFRKSYDALCKHNKTYAHKHYLSILHLSKLHGEQVVSIALELLSEANEPALPEKVKDLLDAGIKLSKEVKVDMPNLLTYDSLHDFQVQEGAL